MDNPIQELIQNAIDANYNAANNSFGSVINSKISDVLDLERERLANQFYNGISDTDEGDDELSGESAETTEGGEEDDIDSQTEISDESDEEEDDDFEITDDEMEQAIDELDDE